MEQRLRALQSDFVVLQQSCESLQCEKQQWLKEKAEHTTAEADKTAKIALLEEQLNQLSEAHSKSFTSVNKVLIISSLFGCFTTYCT